jgi:acetyl-CoA C-acetyltransferase
MNTKMEVKDKKTGETSLVDYVVTRDEVGRVVSLSSPHSSQCNRPGTQLSDIANLSPVRFEADPLATITAGNASQLSDGASACVLMDEKSAERRGQCSLLHCHTDDR